MGTVLNECDWTAMLNETGWVQYSMSVTGLALIVIGLVHYSMCDWLDT